MISILRRNATIALAGLVIAGCATKAANIAPIYISPIVYQNYSCEQLAAEASRLSQRAAEISGVQDKKASGDALATGVALILFWPALFFIKGNGATEAEVGRLKGEMEAVEQAAIQNKCGLQFDPGQNAQAPEIVPAPSPKKVL